MSGEGEGGSSAAGASPLTPLIGGLGLLLLVAALVTKTLTTGGGIELRQPGAQLLFDLVLVCGAAALTLSRALTGRGSIAPRAVLGASAAAALVLVVCAARASHADVAWRTALSWGGLLLLALVAHDVGDEGGRERCAPRARALGGAALALVTGAAGLALWQRLIEHPRLVAEYERGGLEAALGPMDAAFRQAMHERIHSPEAAGPFLLPALLCCACAMLLPLALTTLWARRRRPEGAALALVVLALLGAAAQTQSKGGAIALAAALGALALLHPRAAPWRGRILLALAGLAGLGLVAGLIAWALHPEAEGVGLSLAVRLEYWSAGLAIARDHPLLGAGLNQFRELYSTYKSARAEEVLHAHNAAVQLLAETGAVGLLVALGVLGAWARAGLRALDARDRGEAVVAEEHAADGDAPGRMLGWTVGGLLLGVFLVGAFGDAYSFEADTLAHVLVLALALPPLAALGWWALGHVTPRLVASALLAGVAAFLADALLDFGLHHAGVSTLAALLLGLGTGVAAAPTRAGADRRPLVLAIGFAAGGLALVVMALVLPGALAADQARARAAAAHLEAAQVSGPERAALLDAAAEDLALATSAYPWHARTWLERAAVERARGRLDEAVAAAEAAVARAPASASAWTDLGGLRREQGDLRGGLEALEEAARRYPTDPGVLLSLGLSRAEAALRADGSAAAPVAHAREALQRALAASQAVRQVSRRLSAEQLVSLGRALADLAGDRASREAALEPLRRALELDDRARAERAAGRRVPDPLRELSEGSRREAERVVEELLRTLAR